MVVAGCSPVIVINRGARDISEHAPRTALKLGTEDSQSNGGISNFGVIRDASVYKASTRWRKVGAVTMEKITLHKYRAPEPG